MPIKNPLFAGCQLHLPVRHLCRVGRDVRIYLFLVRRDAICRKGGRSSAHRVLALSPSPTSTSEKSGDPQNLDVTNQMVAVETSLWHSFASICQALEHNATADSSDRSSKSPVQTERGNNADHIFFQARANAKILPGCTWDENSFH